MNRHPANFEWFINMLSQLEIEQAELTGGVLDRFLDLHMYITSALKKTDMKAVGLQMALDLLHARVLSFFVLSLFKTFFFHSNNVLIKIANVSGKARSCDRIEDTNKRRPAELG